MRPETLGIIIGGLVPAVLFGITSVFAKIGSQEGISAGHFTIIAGIGVLLGGLLLSLFQSSTVPMKTATLWSAGFYGLFWSLGSGLVIFSLIRYRVPVSKLVPLFNMNTLIAVLLVLIIFAEWKSVDLLKLILGAVFIVVGGVLVSVA